MPSLQLSPEDISAELSVLEVDIKGMTGEEYLVLCPSPKHDDTRASTYLNSITGLWKCHACSATGNFVSFVGYLRNASATDAFRYLHGKYGSPEPSPFDNLANQCRARLMLPEYQYLRDELVARGFSDTRLWDEFQIGIYIHSDRDVRISLPYFDSTKTQIVGLLLYAPGRTTEKFVWANPNRADGSDAHDPAFWRRRRGSHLYGAHLLSEHVTDVVLCGGPVKAAAVNQLLFHLPHVIAVSSPFGESAAGCYSILRGRRVFVIMDIDPAGQAASRLQRTAMAPFASEVRCVELDLDPNLYPKGDICDWIAHERHTAEDLLELMLNSVAWSDGKVAQYELLQRGTNEALFRGISITNDAQVVVETNADWDAAGVGAPQLVLDAYLLPTGDRNKAPASVALPSLTRITCHPSGPKAGEAVNCVSCPAKTEQGYLEVPIKSTSWLAACVLTAPSPGSRKAFSEAVKAVDRQIPGVCKLAFECDLGPAMTYKRVVLVPIRVTNSGLDQMPAFLAPGVPIPSRVAAMKVRYIRVTQPSTSVDCIIISSWEYIQVIRPLDSAQLTSYFGSLARGARTVSQHLSEVADQVAAHITQIYHEPLLTLASVLTFTSPLRLALPDEAELPEELGAAGKLETLIIGDPGTGKSQTMLRLSNLTGSEIVDGSQATAPGLLAGVDMSSRTVALGAFARANTGLVIIEEMQLINPLVSVQLRQTRSSGVVQVTKIVNAKIDARCRMIMIANPIIRTRNDQPVQVSLAAHNSVEQVLAPLVPAAADRRRFDIVLMVKAKANGVEAPEGIPGTVYSDALALAIQHAWAQETAEISPELWATARKLANQPILGRKRQDYGDEGAHISAPDFAVKLLKIAAAAAILCAEEVNAAHIQWAHGFVEQIVAHNGAHFGEKILPEAGPSGLSEVLARVDEKLRFDSQFIANLCDYLAMSTNGNFQTSVSYLRGICDDRGISVARLLRILQENGIVDLCSALSGAWIKTIREAAEHFNGTYKANMQAMGFDDI